MFPLVPVCCKLATTKVTIGGYSRHPCTRGYPTSASPTAMLEEAGAEQQQVTTIHARKGPQPAHLQPCRALHSHSQVGCVRSQVGQGSSERPSPKPSALPSPVSIGAGVHPREQPSRKRRNCKYERQRTTGIKIIKYI